MSFITHELAVALILLTTPQILHAEDSPMNPAFASDWSGSRTWIGPEFWASAICTTDPARKPSPGWRWKATPLSTGRPGVERTRSPVTCQLS